MKKIVKLTESDLMNIIKRVIKEATPAPTGANKVGGPKKVPGCTGSMTVSTNNGCTIQCNGQGGYTAAQGSAVVGNACSDPIVPIFCTCSKGGISR
jgi:hypothetical protein